MTRATLLTAATAALIGAGAALPALADRGPGDRARLDFEAIDADGSGSLSTAELTGRATSRIAEADANGDGALDRDELVAAMPDPRPAFARPFASDRAADRADRMLAIMGATEAGRIEIDALAGRQVDRLLAVADTDRDGEISAGEAGALRDRVADRGHRRGDRF